MKKKGSLVFKNRWTLFLLGILVFGLIILVNHCARLAEAFHSLSGRITGADEITVNLSGPMTAVTSTDASGNYEFINVADGDYRITPEKRGYNFDPLSREVTVRRANLMGIDFTATAIKYSISGIISWEGSPTNNKLIVWVATTPIDPSALWNPTWVQRYIVTYEVYSSISGGSQSYNVSGLNFGTYYLLGVTAPFPDAPVLGDKIGEFSDGLIPARGGSPEAMVTGVTSNITGKNFRLGVTLPP